MAMCPLCDGFAHHFITDDEQTVPRDYAVRVCNSFAQLGARGVRYISFLPLSIYVCETIVDLTEL